MTQISIDDLGAYTERYSRWRMARYTSLEKYDLVDFSFIPPNSEVVCPEFNNMLYPTKDYVNVMLVTVIKEYLNE